MTQEQLAEKLNVSRQTISKWESGSSSQDIESVVKVSEIFQASLDDLLKEGDAGVIGLTLCLCYIFKSRKKVENMCRLKRNILGSILCVLIVSLCVCGKENKSDDNASHPELLVTSQVYDDGMGNQAAIACDVYYLVDGKIKNIGQIESFGTAYPIAYDKTGIYAVSGHIRTCVAVHGSTTLRCEQAS